MKPLLLTFNLLCVADITTTDVALQRDGREIIVPTQNPVVVDVVLGVDAGIESWALARLDRHGHPKLARVLGWSIVGLRAAVVLHNLKELQR